jgi:hypothetical protein
MQRSPPRTALEALGRATATHVAFAFIAMGGWAAFANAPKGLYHAAIAGLVQGTLSGLITLGLKRYLESVSLRLPGIWAILLPPASSCAVILVLLLTAHRLAGTPNVWATISVPYAVSSVYAWIYVIVVVRGRRAAQLLEAS